MCGIVGFILDKNTSSINLDVIRKMNSQLERRGPDGEGYWINENKTEYLAHRRLSIIELTEKGAQPMQSLNKNLIISFNGEIYNHLQIRDKINKIKNVKWRSNSDTETLLVSIETFGIEETLENIVGMFAFALIDKNKNKLILARDRNGEKPLYYGSVGSSFIFGSELKALICFPGFKKKLNSEALNMFLDYSYIPEPYSIFENIFKLEKSSYLQFDLLSKKIVKIKKYNFANKIEIYKNSANINYIEKLDEILQKAVHISSTSDVEVGTFLSGGTDSSLITAIMSTNFNKSVKTFSVSVKNPRYDESKYSENIANYLKTDHYQLNVEEKDLIDQTRFVADIYDEPFADSSQIPTSLISKFASKKVKVILSGDGADEFFGGYNRYLGIKTISKYFNFLPFKLRKIIGSIISKSPKFFFNFIENSFSKSRKNENNFNQIEEKLIKLSTLLIKSKDIDDIYSIILKNYNLNENLLINQNTSHEFDNKILSYSNNNNQPHENMMKIDQEFYLTNDILNKVDRAAMYYSLETRMPFLNPELTKFSKIIPNHLKINKGVGKWILKQLLKRYLPDKFVDRPKMGFSIPIDLWLRTSLKGWAKDILLEKKIKNHNILNSSTVNNMLLSHTSGKKNYGTQLWNLIILQNWIDKYL